MALTKASADPESLLKGLANVKYLAEGVRHITCWFISMRVPLSAAVVKQSGYVSLKKLKLDFSFQTF